MRDIAKRFICEEEIQTRNDPGIRSQRTKEAGSRKQWTFINSKTACGSGGPAMTQCSTDRPHSREPIPPSGAEGSCRGGRACFRGKIAVHLRNRPGTARETFSFGVQGAKEIPRNPTPTQGTINTPAFFHARCSSARFGHSFRDLVYVAESRT